MSIIFGFNKTRRHFWGALQWYDWEWTQCHLVPSPNKQIYRCLNPYLPKSVFSSGQMVPTKSGLRRCYCGSRWKVKHITNTKVYPLPHGLLLVNLLCFVRFPLGISLLAPLVCWLTLTVVLSGMSVASSTKFRSIRVVKIFSHIPAFVHIRKQTLPWFTIARIVLANLTMKLLCLTSIALHRASLGCFSLGGLPATFKNRFLILFHFFAYFMSPYAPYSIIFMVYLQYSNFKNRL